MPWLSACALEVVECLSNIPVFITTISKGPAVDITGALCTSSIESSAKIAAIISK
jgi:hypothetical protein